MPHKRGRRPDFFRRLYEEAPIKQLELPWPTDLDSESGMLIDSWDADKQKFVRRLQVVGEYPNPPPARGIRVLSLDFPEQEKSIPPLVIIESVKKHERVHSEPIRVLNTSFSGTPRQFIQWLRNQYNLKSFPMTVTVDNTQPALLDALRGINIQHSHSMRKKPCKPPEWYPEVKLELSRTRLLDTGELPAPFSGCPEVVLARFKMRSKSIHDAVDLRPKGADWRYFNDELEMLLPLPFQVNTVGHYFFRALNKEGQRVGMLWLQISEDKSWSQCHYIEVKPAYRRMGYGAKIVSFWQALALRLGVDVLLVDIIGGSREAEGLFAAMGFITVEKTAGMRRSKKSDVVGIAGRSSASTA